MDYQDPSVNYTTTTATDGGTASVMLLVWLAVFIVVMWRLFTKAGRPGWASLIPFYNVYVMLKMVGRPDWWLLLFFIPMVNLVVSVILSIDLAKSFGKDAVFGVLGLFFFGFIGYPILAFGSSKYVGPSADGGATPAAPAAPAAPPAA